MRTTLSMHHIARIEGHGNISLSIEDGRVSDVKMNVVEPPVYSSRWWEDVPSPKRAISPHVFAEFARRAT